MTSVATLLLLLSVCIRTSLAQSGCESNPCDPATHHCEGGDTTESIGLEFYCVENGYRFGNCSFNTRETCVEEAACKETDDHYSFKCICNNPEATGNGIQESKGGSECKLPYKPCTRDNECHQYAKCDPVELKCFCDPGFIGDGENCTDILECDDEATCDLNANCIEKPGSYECVCDSSRNYVGDGKNCSLICYSDNDCDALRAYCNDDQACICRPGYMAVLDGCEDVNECRSPDLNNCPADSNCENEIGGFSCECKNGFIENQEGCEALPKDCHEIPGWIPKRLYLIDPDGSGPANAFDVECAQIKSVTVTIVRPLDRVPTEAGPDDDEIIVDYQPKPSDLVPLLDNSVYCFQDLTFQCYSGFALYPGTKWYDAFGNYHENWGSDIQYHCACGATQACDGCYCDGKQTRWLTTEEGRIVNKNRLPLINMTFEAPGQRKGKLDVGPLTCAQEPVDLPIDCDDAKKNYGVRKNTPLYIDVDGNGPTPAMLVFCDVETYSHVGVTQIYPTEDSFVITTPEEKEVEYTVPGDSIEALINGSVFCSQQIEFLCYNSPLLGENGGYIVGPTRRLDYFPGANGKQDMCGCGTTRSCIDPEVYCNCNLPRARNQLDFGLIINKEDLPALRLKASVTGGGRGRYKVGPLQCSQKQFGIEPNCEKYRSRGVDKSYTYFIDPDGPGNLDPFLAECRFREVPPLGETIIHHNNEAEQSVDKPLLELHYLQASPDQINALKTRSTFCTQEIKFSCNNMELQSIDSINFIPANSSTPLSLADFLETCEGDTCNCDGNSIAEDSGTLADLGYVPVKSLDFANIQQLSGTGMIEVGPMVCSEIFPSCALLQKFIDSDLAVEGEGDVINGAFTIDADGPGGVEPFSVRCQFPTTLVDITTNTRTTITQPGEEFKEECHDVKYKSGTGETISNEQINALVKRSGACRQQLTLECTNAPASGNVNFTSCDGKSQTGWAGSFGGDACACGVSGVCQGGPDAKCNCDVNDDVTRSDKGVILDNSRLPVCEICLKVYSKTATEGNPQPTSMLTYKVGQLRCDGSPGTKGTCQHSRVASTLTFDDDEESKEVPVTLSLNGNHIPVACQYYKNPQVGKLLIRPRTPSKTVEEDENVDISVDYFFYRIDLIKTVLQKNVYCRQKIYIFCLNDQEIVFGAGKGFMDAEGNINEDWEHLDDDGEDVTAACNQYSDVCSRCGRPTGFLLTNKNTLPVSTIILAVKGVTIVVDSVECFNIKTSCQQLLDDGNIWFGYLGRSKYLIDPDGPRNLFPFRVRCAFNKKERNGVTIIDNVGDYAGNVVVTGKNEPGKFEIPIEYRDASLEQIKSLTQISDFCWQGVRYQCQHSPLLDGGVNPDSFYTYYQEDLFSPSFATGADINYPGCPCGLLGTCVNPNVTCNCDAREPMGMDTGFVSDKRKLPLESFTVGGQVADSEVSIKITPIRCQSKRIEPPKDCAQAYQFGTVYGTDFTVSGEYLISPDPENVEPFMVRCEYEKFNGVAVTVIKPDKDPDVPHTDPNEPFDVPYKGPTDEQIRALIAQSKYCYQGVSYTCYASELLEGGSYFKTTGKTDRYYFWGGGEPRGSTSGVCACGVDGLCGGLDSRQGQKNRKCNCDVGDNFPRVDAGIFSQKEYLPLGRFVSQTSRIELNVTITVGDLYCADEEIELDECEMGFSDCHPLADCVDEKHGYRCVCKPGWQGKTGNVDRDGPRANGRECIDDQECTWKPCPISANCTNTPGSFYCTCLEGFRQTGPLECEDIDECAEESLNECDVNARCENLVGSYRCACERGYRGNGRQCYPVGQCSCFGDPHCLSFDKQWLHFQGECEYVMARDNCEPGGVPSFMVITNHWKQGYTRPGYFSWIKSVKVLYSTFVVELGQGGDIYVNTVKVDQFVSPGVIFISKIGQIVTLVTENGLMVKWDGIDGVDVTIPTNLKGQTCGLCGNYNDQPSDDWIVGPLCEEKTGTVTANFDLFGNSWTYQVDRECEVDCEPPMPEYPGQCENERLVELECGKIFNTDTSPFKPCLRYLGAEELRVLKENCVFDICRENLDFWGALCLKAERLAATCRDELSFIVTGWRDQIEACDADICENNMIRTTCAPPNPNTCLSRRFDMPEVALNSDDCIEGCMCGEGMVLDIDHCVHPEDCGCFYENMYLQKNDVMITKDCLYKIECLGNDYVEKTDYTCGENMECGMEDGISGCFCRDGYRLSEDGEYCYNDPCYGVNCTDIPNQECVDGVCQCKMGYVGDCNQCVNIDECATGLANCNRIGQTCRDVNGSFSCECEPGFIPTKYGCTDVDECASYDDVCGTNDYAECSNTLGSYVCECCSGYKMNANKQCIRDNSVPVAVQCCACQGDKCLEPGEVCGTDGVNYKDYRTLVIASCRDPAKSDLKVNYPGPCKPTCELVTCKKQYAVCQMEDGIPKCNCPKCEDSSFSIYENVVCATNKITYNSVCHMKEATCEAELETTVEVETTGRPCGQGPGIVVGPWSEWGECSEPCKQGMKNRTRNVPEGSSLPKIVFIPCFSSCSEGPCTLGFCKGPGQICTVDGNNVPSCSCEDCTGYPEELLCGRVGRYIKTFLSECDLQAQACKEGVPDYEILEPRACEDKPKECGLIRNYQQPEDENGCKAEASVNLGACYGGCDQTAELCCFGDETVEKSVMMNCGDGSRYRKWVQTIKACNCRTKEDVENLKMTMNVVK